MCQKTWEDLGMSCRMYLALKTSDSSGDLVVSIVRVIFFIVGGNGSGESRVSDEPSYPGNLNRRPRMSAWGSWTVLLSHPAESAGCEISGEGRTSAGQNCGCEISGESGMSAGQNCGCETSEESGMSAGQNCGCETSGWNERWFSVRMEWAMPCVARGWSACPREREPRGIFWGGSHSVTLKSYFL